ncbi:MAG TPA: M14 family metallopeptidase, partial [Candidatus Thermoplasmatota archaeon]|nr:M14 family metallopeptidase [Candidatus Thermoplasmatota archaeon]
HMELLFVFPQPDGWTHEEVQYRMGCARYIGSVPLPTGGCVDSQNFVRTNGNGKDVNRQWPTIGWVREVYEPMSQPEAQALVAYLKNETNIKYASDIHGMLNPADGGIGLGCMFGALNIVEDPMEFDPTCFANAVTDAKGHYVLTMLPAARQDPREMMANTQLAELIKERLNANPYFAEWRALPNSAGGAWGGAFNDWGTVWDTIGYTDSGFTSDFYAQDHGLNAAGVNFELSYNHVTFDNYYPGAAQRMNAYHVEIVREIVRAFMDQANQDIQLSVDVKGTRTAFLDNPTVVTNAADRSPTGWAAKNAGDDAWDSRVWRASPNDYFTDLQRYAKDADRPGIVDSIRPGALADLARYDNLVVAGSAYKTLNAGHFAAIKAWVERGGNLVLTDEALQMLEDLGLVEEGAVDVHMGYAGATNFVDFSHPLATGIRGLARETYEPVPLGFAVDGLNAPNWFVSAAAFDGEVVGVGGRGQGAVPDDSMVNYGTTILGAGRVSFLGALLPDPVDGASVLYGLDSYATTYTGNQLLRNMLGWDVVFAQTPVATQELAGRAAKAEAAGAVADQGGAQVPAPAIGLVLLAVALLALRRRA